MTVFLAIGAKLGRRRGRRPPPKTAEWDRGIPLAESGYRPGQGADLTGTVSRVGAADRLRSWGRKALGNPWLAVGIVIGLLLVCAWIGWAIHVGSEHGSREALGVLIVWPAIAVVLALISIPFIWAFRVLRASGRSDEPRADTDAEATETG